MGRVDAEHPPVPSVLTKFRAFGQIAGVSAKSCPTGRIALNCTDLIPPIPLCTHLLRFGTCPAGAAPFAQLRLCRLGQFGRVDRLVHERQQRRVFR